MSDLQPRRALMTGATGFVGLNLARRLKSDGWDVHAIVRQSSNKEQVEKLLGTTNVHQHDETMGRMLEIVRSTKPVVVFHLASFVFAQHTSAELSSIIRSNIEFPAQLLEAAATEHVPYFINTGTFWQHYQDEEYAPVNLYAASKQAFLDILRYYADAKLVRAINLELFDTFGPNDPRPKLFTLLHRAAGSGETLEMTPGEQLVDPIYIDDVVNAYVVAAGRIAISQETMETFCVNSGAPVRLRELVEMWQKVVGRSLSIRWGARAYRPREIMKPWRKGKRLPGWERQFTLEEGIRRMEGMGNIGGSEWGSE